MAERSERIEKLLNQDFRNLHMGYSGKKFSINITGRKLMVEYPDGLDAQKIADMAGFACAMSIL